MAELSCLQCQALAAELALGVLSCHERADALAHLEGCSSCQDRVSALTVTADRLVELLPPVEPPAGFEQRVINALTPPPPPPRAQRWRLPVAAGLAAVALATGGWIVGRATHNLTPTQANTPTSNDAQAGERTVLYAPLTTAQHGTVEQQVGQAYIYPGHPSWIYLSLDTPNTTPGDTVRCEVVRRDGSTVPVGSFSVTNGRGAWGGPAPVDRDSLATARLINRNGHTLAKAHFAASRNTSSQPTPRRHTEHHLRGHS